MFGHRQYRSHMSPNMSQVGCGDGQYYQHHHHKHTTQLGTNQPHQQHDVFEVCSSFYTNNPLLYVSHYSEIIVTSGYDVSGVKPQGMLPQGLSSHRELVEQLDPELIYDYLRQNGVLEDHEVAEVRQERSPAKVNLSLLTKVEEHGKSAEGLLIIALRQSGQHYLANLLDDTDRIKALSGSGMYYILI